MEYKKQGEYLVLIGLILFVGCAVLVRLPIVSGIGLFLALAGGIVVYTNQ